MCSPIICPIDPHSQQLEGQLVQQLPHERTLADLPNEIALRILSFFDSGKEAKEFCLLNKRFSVLLPYVARIFSEKVSKIFFQFEVPLHPYFKPSRRTMDLSPREGKLWQAQAHLFFKRSCLFIEELKNLFPDGPRATLSSKEILERPENLRKFLECLISIEPPSGTGKNFEPMCKEIAAHHELAQRTLPLESEEPSEYEPVAKRPCLQQTPPQEEGPIALVEVPVKVFARIAWYCDSLEEAKETLLLNKSLPEALPIVYKVFAERIAEVNDAFKMPFHPQFTPVDPKRPSSLENLPGLRQTKCEAFYFFRQMKEVIDAIKANFPQIIPFMNSTKEIVENPDMLRDFYFSYLEKFQ